MNLSFKMWVVFFSLPPDFVYPWVESLDWERQRKKINDRWQWKQREGRLWYRGVREILTVLTSLLCPTPRTFEILNSRFSVCITQGTQYENVHLTDFIMYAMKSTWHGTASRAKFLALAVPCACAWLAPGDCGWQASFLRWVCILPVRGACCMQFTLYTAFEAPNLRLENYSRDRRPFYWELQTRRI